MGWAGGESESQCDLLRKSIFSLFFLFYSLKQGDSWSAESWEEGSSALGPPNSPGPVLYVSGSLPSHRWDLTVRFSLLGPTPMKATSLPPMPIHILGSTCSNRQ